MTRLAMLLLTVACAQAGPLVGTWRGTFERSPGKLRIQFTLTSNDKGELCGTLDSLD